MTPGDVTRVDELDLGDYVPLDLGDEDGSEAAQDGPGDPIGLEGVDYTGKPGEDSLREFSEVLRQFKMRDSREKERKADSYDCEYFTVLVFQTKAQRDAFVTAVGEDGPDWQYLDGLRIAERFAVELPEVDRHYRPPSIDPVYRDYAI